MPTKQECDDYAVAVVEHFDAFVDWAISHWPDRQTPLVADDFHSGRREISALLGARLAAMRDGGRPSVGKPSVDKPTTSSPSVGPSDASEQYISVNPAPWP